MTHITRSPFHLPNNFVEMFTKNMMLCIDEYETNQTTTAHKHRIYSIKHFLSYSASIAAALTFMASIVALSNKEIESTQQDSSVITASLKNDILYYYLLPDAQTLYDYETE